MLPNVLKLTIRRSHHKKNKVIYLSCYITGKQQVIKFRIYAFKIQLQNTTNNLQVFI